jgi:hypothetical protein
MSNLPALIILIILIASALSIVFYSLRCGISPMPSSAKAVRAICSLLTKYRPKGTVVELGSGWGTLATFIAAEFPGCTVTGMELSPVPFVFSCMVSRILQLPNCRIVRKNFFEASLEDTEVIVCYLCTPLMSRLRLKFERECAAGTLIISNTFAVTGWEPVETVTLDDMFGTKIYLYQV